MTEAIILPPGVSISILAFLLSLLPASLFLWLWYLRRHDRPVPGSAVALALGFGALVVIPAFYLETYAHQAWQYFSPATAHFFSGAVLPLRGLTDILLPAVGTFAIVATVEEGLRYLVLLVWFRKSRAVDQVFDGLVIGVAAGLGFATVENTLYFLDLFTRGSFDTLVFVFFLRFMISTLAHISFGGIMGALLARGYFDLYRRGRYFVPAFFIPWFVHGLFDLLLAINVSTYAVLLIVPLLLTLIAWTGRRDFFVINRAEGRQLVGQKAPVTREAALMHAFFKRSESPWNAQAPWLREKRLHRSLVHQLEDTTPS